MAGHPDAGRQIGYSFRQVAGQKLEDAAKRQAIGVDRLDSSRVRIEVTQFGQGLARPADLRGTDRDERPGLAAGCEIEAAGVQRPAPPCHHLLSLAQQRVSAGEAVGGKCRERLIVGVLARLVECGAEAHVRPLRVGPRRRPWRPAHSCARGTRRGVDGFSQRQTTDLFGQHQVQHGDEQPSLAIGPLWGNISGPQKVGGCHRQPPPPGLFVCQTLEAGGQVLVGVVQRGHPVIPGRPSSTRPTARACNSRLFPAGRLA